MSTYKGLRDKISHQARASLFHTMTRQDVIDNSVDQGGCHIIMSAKGYEVIYEAVTMYTSRYKDEAEKAAITLSVDHIGACDIYDYTAAPITEGDTE